MPVRHPSPETATMAGCLSALSRRRPAATCASSNRHPSPRATTRQLTRIAGVRETLDSPHRLEPPPGGSVFRVLVFPPEVTYWGKLGKKEVEAYYQAMGSPAASTYSTNAPHPYMQRTRTLDFCLVVEGEITLVLDTQEVQLRAGDT